MEKIYNPEKCVQCNLAPAKGKEHIATATLGEDGQVHLYDPQNNKCDKIMIKERGKNGKKKGTEQEGN